MRLIVLVSIANAVVSMRPMQKTMQKALRKAVAPTAAAIALLGGSTAANAALREDVVELADASYPILKQFKPEAFQPFVGKVSAILVKSPEFAATVDAALDWFNSVPDANVAKTTDAVKAAMDGLDPASCDLIPLPSTESWEAFAAKATAGADAGKLKTFADRAAPVVAALKRADGDRVCLPPVAKLETAALAQADAAAAASSGAGAKFNAQAGKYGASLPKGPLIQLFGGYEGAKQTLGASREDRARFERAGKIVEQRATILSRQMKGM